MPLTKREKCLSAPTVDKSSDMWKNNGDNIGIDPEYEKDKNTCYFDRN